MTFYYWFTIVQDVLSFGYICFIPLLLVSWLTLKSYRVKTIQIISIANGWFCMYAACIIWQLFINWFDSSNYEGYQYIFNGKPVAESSIQQLFTLFKLQFSLQIICFFVFLFRKGRRSILITILACLSLHLVSILSQFFSLETTSRGYISFERQVPWWQNNFVYLMIYVLLITTTYFIKEKITSRHSVVHS